MCHCHENKLSTLKVRRPEQNTALNARTEQLMTAKISGNGLKHVSRTHSTLRQYSSPTAKTSGSANVSSNSSRAEKVCGHDGRHPGLTVWNFRNYTRIENAHEVRKKTSVFYNVDLSLCITTGGREQTGTPEQQYGRRSEKELRAMETYEKTKNRYQLAYFCFCSSTMLT